MNKEKVIKDLEKYYRFKNYVVPNIKNKIKVIEYELEGVGALQYSDMPGPTGSKKVSYQKEKLIDKKTKMELDLKAKEAFIIYIEDAIKFMGSEKDIVIECYCKDKFEKLKEQDICRKLSISKSTLYRKRNELLEDLIMRLEG
ncbi:MAG: hypothetical protein ACRCW0_00225 [Clostridium sp.]